LARLYQPPAFLPFSMAKSRPAVQVGLDIQLNEKIHDREVRIDNGWTVKIGRGLDYYQKPDGWFSIGANDLALRKCLETKVDIFKHL
jgi:ATP-dependent Lon protease